MTLMSSHFQTEETQECTCTSPMNCSTRGCLWGGPPAWAARPVCPMDLRARSIRVKQALTVHGKSNLPCPRWLPPGPPHHHASGRRREAGRGRNGTYGMSGADPVGDNGKAGKGGKDGRARTPLAQTGM
jgi:hypothetical protein